VCVYVRVCVYVCYIARKTETLRKKKQNINFAKH